MRIAVLHASLSSSTSPIAALDLDRDPSPFAPEHTWTHLHLSKADAVATLQREAGRHDLFFNLCDGAWDEDRAGVEVCMALERLGVPHVGPDALHYEPPRTAQKMAAHSVGVAVPGFVEARDEADLERAARLRFPLLVKHPGGYSSVGLTPASRVTTADALRVQARAAIEAWGAALVEEFIEGRECTVLVADAAADAEEPWALTPVEFRFPPGETWKHFDLKWKDFERMTTLPVAEPALDRALRDAAAAVFDALELTSYARADFRVDADGRIWFLEINLCCGVFYPEGQHGSADHILALDPAGPSGFVRHLIDRALARHRPPTHRLTFDQARGFGLVAARPLAAGDVAVADEEKPLRVVSRRHAEQTWRGRRRTWFHRYAWPLTEGVFAYWSADPAAWRPIDHGCDPNTWLVGLDLVARRAIAEGEGLTVDYATFCGPDMTPFACSCGAATCRGRITGDDLASRELRALYAGHTTDHVWTRTARG